MTEEIGLPAGFEALAAYDDWALPTSDERLQKRMDSSMEEIQRFYDAVLPLVDAALAHLDAFPLDGLPPAEQKLFSLLLASTEAALAVEVYLAPQLPLSPSASRFRTTHMHMGGA